MFNLTDTIKLAIATLLGCALFVAGCNLGGCGRARAYQRGFRAGRATCDEVKPRWRGDADALEPIPAER